MRTFFSRHFRLPRIEGLTDTTHMQSDLNLTVGARSKRHDLPLLNLTYLPR